MFPTQYGTENILDLLPGEVLKVWCYWIWKGNPVHTIIYCKSITILFSILLTKKHKYRVLVLHKFTLKYCGDLVFIKVSNSQAWNVSGRLSFRQRTYFFSCSKGKINSSIEIAHFMACLITSFVSQNIWAT